MNPSPTIITQQQYLLINQWIDYFTDQQMPYQATGGLAGNLHGSKWRLHDLDFETNLAQLYKIEQDFSAYVTRPVHRYQDEEFDIWLLQLKMEAIEVDINAVEAFYVFNGQGEKILIISDLAQAEALLFDARRIRVQPLKDLIHYKKILQRNADVMELEGLLARQS
ncbi:MAG: nucleotidyltransferase domain-containing protein [Saprospiraceae bacterium]